MTFALYIANRGFFPAEVIQEAREELLAAVGRSGHRCICMEESKTKYGYDICNFIAENGYKHHLCVALDDCRDSIKEAFEKYLGIETAVF